MTRLLMGTETELAFVVRMRDGAETSPALRQASLAEFFALARRDGPWLPGAGHSGLYLACGHRLYLDAGEHPEICTPECHDPLSLVTWSIAGERRLERILAQLAAAHPGAEFLLYRCNVDYTGNAATWGCHGNYQVCGDVREVGTQLIPHLVTRIIYSGAGGFNNVRARREFLLSPRVPHMREAAAWSPTSWLALIHLRGENLCHGYKRLHLVCGESLCSQLSTYLKVGTTALIARLAEVGKCPGNALQLEHPLAAMLTIARDVQCRKPVQLANDTQRSAIEIQREYLEAAEKHLGADFMPDWAPELCRRWREVLDDLAEDPLLLGTRLDWAIKLALFRHHQREHRAPRAQLSAELAELDLRFGELGEGGVFRRLERAGVLDHALVDEAAIQHAMHEPPPGGRAEARGRTIRKLSEKGDRYVCNWHYIRDMSSGRELDMNDPFDTHPKWRARSSKPRLSLAAGVLSLDAGMRPRMAVAIDHLNELRSVYATRTLRVCVREAADNPELSSQSRFWLASALQDQGLIDEVISTLTPVLSVAQGNIAAVTAVRVWTRFTLALIEKPAPLAVIQDALLTTDTLCSRFGETLGRSRVTLLRSRLLDARGLHTEAAEQMRTAIAQRPDDPSHFGLASYLRWLVRFQVRAGDLERAEQTLASWGEEDGDTRFKRITIQTAESELRLTQRRPRQALVAARGALRASSRLPRHRSRAGAVCAFVRAAVASGQAHEASHVIHELDAWQNSGIGALRHQAHALRLLHARALDGGLPLDEHGPLGPELLEARRLSAELDRLLACSHRTRELRAATTDPL